MYQNIPVCRYVAKKAVIYEQMRIPRNMILVAKRNANKFNPLPIVNCSWKLHEQLCKPKHNQLLS